MEPGASQKGVQSGARMLEVLSCFSTHHTEWGVSEIAEYLGVVKSAVHRSLQTLEGFGYVERTAAHRYRLGVRALELGRVYRFQTLLLEAADEPMRELADRTGLAVHLAQFNRSDILELFRAVGRLESGRKGPPVLRKPVHASALGKVLLAAADPAVVDRFIGLKKALTRYTEFTVVDPEQLREELVRVRRDGYALDRQESEYGRHCLGVPVRGSQQEVVAALSISSSGVAFSGRERDSCLRQLLKTAGTIHRRLLAPPAAPHC